MLIASTRWSGRLVWVAGAIYLFKSLWVRLYNADLWWHLAAGREMIQRRTFLWTDVFSWTMEGRPWINFEWLSQFIFYGVYAVGGFWGLYFLKIVFCLVIVLLMILTLRSQGLRGPALFLLTWMAVKIFQPRFQDRPELFTLVFMALYLLGVVALRARLQAEKSPSTSVHRFFPSSAFLLKALPWWMGAVMLFWVNTHGGFVFGVGLTALFWLGLRWENTYASLARAMGLALGVICVALLFNPHGHRLVMVFWEHYQQMKIGAHLIQEWKPAGVRELPVFWVAYVLVAGALIQGVASRWKEIRFWLPAVSVFLIWGTFFYRNAAMAGFVVVAFLAAWIQWEGHPARRLLLRGSAHHRGIFVVAGWLIALSLLLSEPRVFARSFPSEPVVQGRFPSGACDFLRRTGIQGRLYNNYDIGGYLIWALGPQRRVFQDGRYLFFPFLLEESARLEGFASGTRGADAWAGFFETHQIDLALVNYSETEFHFPAEVAPFPVSVTSVMFPRATWALVYWDDSALVFVKRNPTQARFIQEQEYVALRPYALEQMKAMVQSKQITKESLRLELARHQREQGFSVRANEIRSLLGEW